MPRDLTDLMERATSFAPPEPHAAADITRLAAHRQRRRTTLVASGAALAVVVLAAGVAVGLTGNQPTRPEPAHRFKLDQSVDVTRAVPVSSLPGYRLEPWTVPSVHRFSSGQTIPTYSSVDASGRLLVVDAPAGDPVHGPFQVRLYDGPGGAAQPVRVPRPASAAWLPTFLGDGSLLWRPNAGSSSDFHLTDLRGGHDQRVPTTFRAGGRQLAATVDDVSGRSMWMTASSTAQAKQGVTVSDVYLGSFSGHVSRVATGVSVLDVGDGNAGWVTTGGQVFVQADSGAAPEQVPVRSGQGCRLLPARLLQPLGAFAVGRSALAVAEQCGTGAGAAERLLVLDLSGRVLARITGATPFAMSFAGDSLVFQANGGVFRYDLVTGSLASLSGPKPAQIIAPPQGSGPYVLWYDGQGGHVARFGD